MPYFQDEKGASTVYFSQKGENLVFSSSLTTAFSIFVAIQQSLHQNQRGKAEHI